MVSSALVPVVLTVLSLLSSITAWQFDGFDHNNIDDFFREGLKRKDKVFCSSVLIVTDFCFSVLASPTPTSHTSVQVKAATSSSSSTTKKVRRFSYAITV